MFFDLHSFCSLRNFFEYFNLLYAGWDAIVKTASIQENGDKCGEKLGELQLIALDAKKKLALRSAALIKIHCCINFKSYKNFENFSCSKAKQKN